MMKKHRYRNFLTGFFVVFLWPQYCQAEIINAENTGRSARSNVHVNTTAEGNDIYAAAEGGGLYTGLNSAQNISLPNENRSIVKGELPDNTNYEGLKQDCYYFLGYQFFGVAVLYVSPQSVSGWTDEQKRNFSIQKYYHDVSNIVWDHDKLYVNYILHPYWGMSYYIRARNRGASGTGALGYSALLSTLWEFGVEALFEEASIQDLIVTPVAGSIIGEYVNAYREGIKRKVVKSNMDSIMLSLTDPLGTLNHWVEDNIGKNASVSFSYSLLQPASVNSLPRWNTVGLDENKSYNLSVSPVYKIRFDYKF